MLSLTGFNFSARFAFQSILPSIHCCTKDNAAACNWSGATTASTAPSFKAASGRFSAPAAIHSTALSIPITRGKRTVPPKPGKIPNLTSGKPTFAAVDMTR